MSNSHDTTYYITTAIPYVNSSPHVGFALETVQADVLARYHRLLGHRVRFLSGTDDNSLKNALAAKAQRCSVADLVAHNAERFLELRDVLALSYDDFIQTSSDPRHAPAVEELWQRCKAAGDIYLDTYDGLYCVGCESFVRPLDLDEGLCAEHRVAPQRVREENYFFRLSKYAAEIRQCIESGRLSIRPEKVRTEVLNQLAEGLNDISISRSRERAAGWGIAVPEDPEHIIYVWFDALANYISALGFGSGGADYETFWSQGDRRTHLVGKGITRFHAVYWPAILLSAGLPLPDELLVHGYLTCAGRKISKSLGNTVAPKELVASHGADSLRHYLLRHVRCTQDGNFSEEALVAAHNAELADQLGNLLSRTVSLIAKRQGGRVVVTESGAPEAELLAVARALPGRVDEALAEFRIHDAAHDIWTFVAAANRYISDNEPWKLAKAGETNPLAVILYHCAESIRLAGVLLAPFLPAASATILQRLGGLPLARSALAWRGADALWPAVRIVSGPPLFPRAEHASA